MSALVDLLARALGQIWPAFFYPSTQPRGEWR